MSTIDNLIKELPFDLYQKHEYRCHCGAIHNKNYRYELKIRILPHYEHGSPAYRFLIYYENNEISNGDSNKYIGRACGFGQATLEEAVKELKGILNEKQENNYAR